ncbi:DoxX family membrane protein [Janibacter terrae]|uniref:DoxX family membrane protein n=1 Tax=Janibacter terrae TaxID=103817 RepID=UPI000833BAA0|nr:DoxX family membrane protein [Janibacter terrae]
MSTHAKHFWSAAPAQPRVGTTSATLTAERAVPYVMATLRLSLGWVFLWAFLDKLFALGFATGRNPETGVVDRFGPDAWINGGSPTLGFLKFGTDGPLADFYQSFAAAAWADWLFMIGLAAIGLSLMLGVGMRIAAAAGALMLVLMWSAALPPANNPFMDDHLVYALALVALALMGAGRTWGLGRMWERLPFVQRHSFLK